MDILLSHSDTYQHNPVTVNFDKYGPLTNASLVIVIQVHQRVNYLRHLIGSFSTAKNISNVLLIFSHDFVDDEINKIISEIDFCEVMQIFYPYSIQKYPNVYPGTDPNDCKRDMKKSEAILKNCTNALYPDTYGHYREATAVQTKLHWWWKMNQVFSHLDMLQNYDGLVLFVEEDNFLSEDFIHILNMMKETADSKCPKCNIFSLGAVNGELTQENSNKLITSVWMSTEHNQGIAFNRSTWNIIRSCTTKFCTIDDYNWDWSLQFISKDCIPNNLNVLQIVGPRIFHLGICGMHFKSEKCDDTKALVTTKIKLEDLKDSLFPASLEGPGRSVRGGYERFRRNGGFSDLRDAILCMEMSL